MADENLQSNTTDELARLAYFDRMLGIPNALRLSQDLRDTEGDGQFLVCFDIQSLRRLNEAYGRHTVDELLACVVAWAQGLFSGCMVYRIGGDEICVRLLHSSAKEALAAAQDIYDRFGEAWTLKIDGQDISILCGASVSVIEVCEQIADDDLLNLIERTLAASRKEDRIVVHDEQMDKAEQEHVRFEMSLKNCVKNHFEGFDVHYQPIVDPAAGTWKGVEALCRWTSPEIGPVPPLVFIKEAEQLGLIKAIGNWVLETAIRQCKAWHLDAVEAFYLSVNLSPMQVMDESLSSRVAKLLKKYDWPGEKLCLEITESTEFNFNNFSLHVIENLRFRGVRISLDDFGTGYSSFNNLKNLPVSFVKTERDFILGIDSDSYMQYLFYILAELAHATDMKIIAEGVETREQLEVILKNGADYVQGYFFSKPLCAADMERQLEKFTRVDPSFYTLTAQPIDARQLFRGKDAYLITPSLFKVLNICMQKLLSEIDLDAAFSEVLAITGEHFKISRVYISQRVDGTVYRCTHEWCDHGIEPQKTLSAGEDLERYSPSWLSTLERDGMIVASDVSRLAPDIHAALVLQNVHAVAVLPMWDNGELIGFVGFDDCRYHDWLPEEIIMLRNLCMVMAGCLKKAKLQQQLYHKSAIFADVLNHMELAVFITDPETDELLWANDMVHSHYQEIGSLVGRKCYDVLQGQPKHCDFCKVEMLLANPEIKQCAWEHFNPITNRSYMVYDSLVHWEDGRKVHLEYALDITENKRTQQQLEYFVRTDQLADTLTRQTLRDVAEGLLDAGEGLCLVIAKITKLPQANELHGRAFGDRLVNDTVTALRKSLRPGDTLGRLGGAEFVAVLPGCGKAEARDLLAEAQKRFAKMNIPPEGEDYTFEYGIAPSALLGSGNSDRFALLVEAARKDLGSLC